MNITTVATGDFNSSRLMFSPETVSGKLNGEAIVPNGSITEGVSLGSCDGVREGEALVVGESVMKIVGKLDVDGIEVGRTCAIVGKSVGMMLGVAVGVAVSIT